jgi:hypothetical protein
MTVTAAPTAGTIAVGQVINALGITPGTTITALGTGTGGIGTYTVNTSQTLFPNAIFTVAQDFYNIPSWVKRITVMFDGVSTAGTSNPLIQIGSGSVSTSGYQSGARDTTNTAAGGGINYTTGFGMASAQATNVLYGHSVLTLVSSNTWVNSHSMYVLIGSTYYTILGAGVSPALSGTLDRVRITTVNGTDRFDAGTVNLLWEG